MGHTKSTWNLRLKERISHRKKRNVLKYFQIEDMCEDSTIKCKDFSRAITRSDLLK